MKPTTQSANGTSFHSVTIKATISQLTDILGEPITGGIEDKVTHKWKAETDEGDIFTVYDWKEYRLIDKDEVIEWHIGAHNWGASETAKKEIETAFNNLKQTNMKQYRISLHKGSNQLAEQLALLAAKSNGGEYISLTELKGIVEGQKRLYPLSNEGVQCEIIGESVLHLDKPVSGEELPCTVLVIEEVELMELEEQIEFNGYGAMAD